MIKFFYLILFAVFLVNSNVSVNAKENFFDKAIKLYNNKNYEDCNNLNLKFMEKFTDKNNNFNYNDYIECIF